MTDMLLVPVEGDVELLPLAAAAHHPVVLDAAVTAAARLALEERGTGPYVEFDLRYEDQMLGKLCFLVGDIVTDANPRAREMLVFLTGAHMVVTGNAVIAGVPQDVLEALHRGDF